MSRLTPDSLRWAATGIAVGMTMVVPLAHDRWGASVAPGTAFFLGTLGLLVATICATGCWPRDHSDRFAPQPRRALAGAAAGAAVAFGLTYLSASRLLPAVFAGPVDPYRADMLVVIEAGVRQFLAGQTPYTTYRIPWPATLPYGPMLWLPYAMPVEARTDVRILTLVGQLFPVACCVIAAVVSYARHRFTAGTALAGLGLLAGFHPYLERFHPIGHSQVYWPLIFVFLWLLRAKHWLAAATALGLLVSARTTMVSLVPIFLMVVYYRARLGRAVLFCLGAATVLPILPFVFLDARSVIYALYGSYSYTVKYAIWIANPTWALNTYGITGPLLERGLQSYAEVAQGVSLAVIYGCAWRFLSRGAQPEPWFALALLVFSMTALWPVIYLYFDVWVVPIGGLVVCSRPLASVRITAVAGAAFAVGALVLAAILAAASKHPGASYSIDIGTAAATPLTGGGFGRDETAIEGERTFVWVEGGNARVRLPRAGWGAADLRIALRPYEPIGGLKQAVTAALNGKPVGLVALRSGWQEVTFRAPAPTWRYGFNVLDLYFSYAIAEAGVPAGAKRLSVAIDRISVD